ncbi:hypothetical protein [Cognatilysobacter lacus]|uniref:Uncharacterized protein n=1 Tax=Cognatilysobacter lacus TaxID=1643323 RepID=A0A5D8Z2H4_9GAMM|nr:hypothetical protein [Lysobacter lacus]TZF88951.1 hypothetical protein FW784_09240 [Lysobacter lacus]
MAFIDKERASYFVRALATVIGFAPVLAQAQSNPGSACYNGKCDYASLADAEAAMRLDGPFGPKFERILTLDQGTITLFLYGVPAQAPETFYPPQYYMDGTPLCDSVLGDGCPDEATAMQMLVADIHTRNPYPGNEFINGQWIGTHADPFYWIGQLASPDRRLGRVSFTRYDELNVRQYQVWIHIPGFPSDDLHYQNRILGKYQAFMCPAGSVAGSGLSAPYLLPGDAPSSAIQWPKFCNVEEQRWIYYKPLPKPTPGLGPCKCDESPGTIAGN